MIRIGSVNIDNPLVLAPMAGITDTAFRVLCKRFGAALVYSEMVNANALTRGNKATERLINLADEERPVSVQIFGSKEDVMVEAAKIVESKGADIVDVNLGCPDSKVIRQGAGAALLRRPKKMGELLSAITKAVRIPVTAKIRLGISEKEGLKTAKILEEAGIAAIAVHGRTADQAYSGKADWNAIKEIKDNLSIPVIGNGDICSGLDAKRVLDEKRCDMVMIGRKAMGCPQIFEEALDGINGKKPKQYSEQEKVRLFFDYLDLAEKYSCFDSATAKVHACHFTKGIRNSASIRNSLTRAQTIGEIRSIMKNSAPTSFA